MDGGLVENIIVDSLRSINTGNVIFLRVGERREGKKGKMNNISISNVYAEVPSTKPDADYNYEGPVEDLPRNISPSAIVDMPDVMIENVTLKNIEIHYPGGGNPFYAKVGIAYRLITTLTDPILPPIGGFIFDTLRVIFFMPVISAYNAFMILPAICSRR